MVFIILGLLPLLLIGVVAILNLLVPQPSFPSAPLSEVDDAERMDLLMSMTMEEADRIIGKEKV